MARYIPVLNRAHIYITWVKLGTIKKCNHCLCWSGDGSLHQPPRCNSSLKPHSTNQRSNSSSDPYTTKQQSNSSSDAHSTNQPSFAAHGRLLDLVQRPTTLRNLSITDTNKLQQRSNSSYDTYSTNQRGNSSSDPYTTKQQSNSSLYQPPRSNSSSDAHSTNQPSFAAHGRLLDLVQRPTTLRNLSITDANKLQQRGHENVTGSNSGYHGDSDRGDRIPSRCSFNEMSVPDIQHAGGQNLGSFPIQRLPNCPQQYYHDTVSKSAPTVAAASHNGRSAWSNSSQSQVMTHGPNYRNIL